MHITLIDQAIRDAERDGTLQDVPDDIVGYSGTKLIGTLQRLSKIYADDSTACYLEIGVFKGLTLLSVANAVPTLSCYGIDNFAFFDPDRENLDLVEARRSALGLSNVTLINKDYEEALKGLNSEINGCKIGVLFVDGPHDYRSQIMCIMMALPYLHEHAVIVIDDSNYRHVRQANADFLQTQSNFKLLFEAYTSCHPANMSEIERSRSERGWWNGVNIIVADPDNIMERKFPPTERSRELFENEHILQASPEASFLPAACDLLSAIRRLSVWNVVRHVVRISRRMRRLGRNVNAPYSAMNTFSDGLSRACHHFSDNNRRSN